MEAKNRDPEWQAVVDRADEVLAFYRDKQCPPTVFHYTSLETGGKILETKRVWCSNVRYANDPSESSYGQKLLDDVVSTDLDLKLEGARRVVGELDTYAASFSADGDLLPQWRAYCRNGRGVAVGVPLDILRPRRSMIFGRVIYALEEQRQLVKDMLDAFRKAVTAARRNESRLKQLVGDLTSYLVIVRSLLKDPAYESEREYRLFDVLPSRMTSANAGIQFRVSGGMLVPFLVAELTESDTLEAQNPIQELRVGPCLDYPLLSASLDMYLAKAGAKSVVTRSSVQMRCD